MTFKNHASDGESYAVVSGASSGIGAATSLLLAENGFHVVAAARRKDRLDALAQKANERGHHIEVVELDITNQKSVDAFAQRLHDKPLEVVVNNAGGAFDAANVLEGDPALWQKSYEVNVLGTMRMVKALTPIMQSHGKGTLVVVTSTAAHVTYETGGSYTAAKHGERALVNTLRLELNGQPIRVIEIAPGMVKTEEFALNRFAGNKESAAKIYAGVDQPLLAEDVAEAIRWSVMLPHHFNVDSMTIRPLAQAAQHKVHRS